MARQLVRARAETRTKRPKRRALASAPLSADQHHTRYRRDFKTRAGDANSSWGSPKQHQSSMKTHGPYNSTTTIIKIDNELKQEDTAALVAFFSFLFT